MSNLMELVNKCPRVEAKESKNVDAALAKAADLDRLGFRALAREIREKDSMVLKQDMLAQYKYVQIHEDRIIRFIKEKAAAYDALHHKFYKSHLISNSSEWPWANYANSIPTLQAHDNTDMTDGFLFEDSASDPGPCAIYSAPTCHLMSNGTATIGKFTWKECVIGNYKKLPPENALAALAEHQARNVFDYFTIAEVNAINDPLLLGRINGDKNRYFLAQWGDDVCLDEVI